MQTVSKIYSAELDGIEAKIIEVETDINVGLHSFNIVGLADKALSEAKERVNSALKNSGVKPPNRENRRITVNLAPADIKKTGSHHDLAIALGYLLATEQIKKFNPEEFIFVGELGLDGKLRGVAGCLNIAETAKKLGKKKILVPEENASEAAAINEIEVFGINNLREAIGFLEGKILKNPAEAINFNFEDNNFSVDISEIKGQALAKRALLVSASGGHHILMSGSPGGGKTMLANAIQSLLPEMSAEETIEVMKIWSAAGLLQKNKKFSWIRPFRSPHHSASVPAVVGGGIIPRPGEISLAHKGVLFLDELPEFRRDILEALRQPIENGRISVSRASGALSFPAKFMLVAAMNPCPCGYFGDEEKECRCSANEVFRYQKKISGPLLDRIDIQIEVPRVKIEDLKNNKRDIEESNKMRKAVKQARDIQKQRFINAGLKISLNSEMSSRETEEFSLLDNEAENFLTQAAEKAFISGRGYFRILKIGRTIADLEQSERVRTEHLAEAFGYRVKD